ncbi:hypothetical protein [Pseudofrankia inefficax]|uniref:hypothetical protein n=1 Tax=Pseudofrankia inefficax (strain DSM 45817 / CECT 9037 / DDB 130130 / EuI1c) TaxID=298654 RepID=UPI0002FA3DE8|nr:hypothetical protein [Pseudofrankia inefficax]
MQQEIPDLRDPPAGTGDQTPGASSPGGVVEQALLLLGIESHAAQPSTGVQAG